MTAQIRELDSLTREELIALIQQEREAVGAGGVSLMSSAKDAEIARFRDALQTIVDRFGPCEGDYIFSKRHALKKARAALAQGEV